MKKQFQVTISLNNIFLLNAIHVNTYMNNFLFKINEFCNECLFLYARKFMYIHIYFVKHTN